MIVRRAKTRKQQPVDQLTPQEILRRINQDVVYVDEREGDITQEIFSRLQKRYRQSKMKSSN
ncbi:MAG: hypothetical protein Tsb009_25310 [Planctomycetaceae bacterium]